MAEILGSVKFPKSVKAHLENHDLWTKWQEVVGTDLARVTSPAEIRGRTLEIIVVHQAWAHQLHFLSPSILNKIRAICPDSGIKALHFKVGKVAAPLPKVASMILDTKSQVKLSERMEMTLRAVDDEDLRTSIRRAMEASARRRRT